MRSIWLLIMLLASPATLAHQAGITDTWLEIGRQRIKVTYTVPTALLDEAARKHDAEPQDWVDAGLLISNNLQPCQRMESRRKELPQILSSQYVLLYRCGNPLDNLSLQYQVFDKNFSGHRNFLRISIDGRHKDVVLSPDGASQSVPVGALRAASINQLEKSDKTVVTQSDDANASSKGQYFMLGIEHILSGYDHILFLISLLLLPLCLKQSAAVLTSFTVAHSITLAASVVEFVSVPPVIAEAMIAASIIYVASENIYKGWHLSELTEMRSPWKRRAVTAFFFGLVHGFGFSYVLKEIGLGDQLVLSLLFFNLGVEAGQLILLILILPLLALLLKHRRGLTFSRWASVSIAMVGSVWLYQRVVF